MRRLIVLATGLLVLAQRAAFADTVNISGYRQSQFARGVTDTSSPLRTAYSIRVHRRLVLSIRLKGDS